MGGASLGHLFPPVPVLGAGPGEGSMSALTTYCFASSWYFSFTCFVTWECNLHTRAPALPRGGFELIRSPSAPLSTVGTVALCLGYLQLLPGTWPSRGGATLL